jgi:heme exporter protein A
MMMDANETLHVTNLHCIRQQQPIFTSLSFQLQSHEILLIEGPNGSGKSSLLRLLTGISTSCDGDIFWCGNNIREIRDEYTKQVHYIGHTNGIKQGLTVVENLQLAQHLSQSTSSALLDILASLQLTAYKNALIKNLSAGQKRRVALARLFLISRKIWLLDEPLTALDSATQAFFLSQLESHLQHGGMAIMSSHHPVSFKNVNVKQLRLESC